MNYDCTTHPMLLFTALLQSLFRNSRELKLRVKRYGKQQGRIFLAQFSFDFSVSYFLSYDTGISILVLKQQAHLLVIVL